MRSMIIIEQDEKNWYYYGNTDIETEKTLEILGFYHNRNEFDEFGNKFEVWVKDKTQRKTDLIGEEDEI